MLRKNNKGIFVAVLIAMLVYLLPISVNAVEHTITITGAGTGHTYEVYQVFTGNIDTVHGVLGDVQWGTGVNNTNLIEALKKSSVVTTKGNISEIFSTCSSAADVAEKISLLSDDADAVKEIAQIIGENLSTTKENMSVSGNDYKAEVEAGYYFVKDKDNTANVSYTRYILSLSNDQTITVKGETPTITTGTSGSSSYANYYDFEIDSTVALEMSGTLPNYNFYKDYSKYNYVFTVTLPNGVTFDGKDYEVELYIDGAKVEDVDLKSNFTYSSLEDGKFTIGCTDLKTIKDLDTKLLSATSAKIVVKYNVKTTKDVSFTNEVKASLTYSNNPNRGHADQTSETPVTTTTLYTYTLKVKSIDEKNKTPLVGTGLKLYKTVDGTKHYAKIENGKITGWTTVESEGTQVTTNDSGEITILGLDAGTYTLTETTTLEGYNTMADTEFTIESTFSESGLASLRITSGDSGSAGTTSDGVVTLEIANKAGSLLPATGGSGTIWIYAIGFGLLLIGLIIIILLFRKKKEDEEENKEENKRK